MFHHWSQATDGTGVAVRVVLFDYRKAFDLIDHNNNNNNKNNFIAFDEGERFLISWVSCER